MPISGGSHSVKLVLILTVFYCCSSTHWDDDHHITGQSHVGDVDDKADSDMKKFSSSLGIEDQY